MAISQHGTSVLFTSHLKDGLVGNLYIHRGLDLPLICVLGVWICLFICVLGVWICLFICVLGIVNLCVRGVVSVCYGSIICVLGVVYLCVRGREFVC